MICETASHIKSQERRAPLDFRQYLTHKYIYANEIKICALDFINVTFRKT